MFFGNTKVAVWISGISSSTALNRIILQQLSMKFANNRCVLFVVCSAQINSNGFIMFVSIGKGCATALVYDIISSSAWWICYLKNKQSHKFIKLSQLIIILFSNPSQTCCVGYQSQNLMSVIFQYIYCLLVT